MRKPLLFILPVIILIIIFLIFFIDANKDREKNEGINYVRAKIVKVIDSRLKEEEDIPDAYVGSQKVKVRILNGKFKGLELIITNSRLHGDLVYDVIAEEGMEVVLAIDEKEGKLHSALIDNYVRDRVIYFLIFLFILALIGVGRVKGIMAFLSLITTGFLIVYFMMPLIFRGYSPILLIIIIVSVITCITLLSIGGFNKKSSAAIIGTVIGVIIAGVISLISGRLAHLTGITGEASEQLIYIMGDFPINIKGIMFAGIIISSLGAVMDVAMSIAATIFEIHNQVPGLSRTELIKSGINVGKDIVGTMANTLILAFTGGSLSMMLLLMAYNVPYFRAINLNSVSTEIIQGLAGSIGLILTVPITSVVAVFLIKQK
ncbi:YibE/F family protein [Halocella sp. SP3-1]|nr:YibE/F family protein [Halocella sp. SP3-1]